MRKGLIQGLSASLALCLTSASFGQNEDITPYLIENEQSDHYFSGFYVGASVGVTFTNVNQDIIGQLIFNTPNGLGATYHATTTGINALRTKNAAKGAFYFGYGDTWKRAYLGSEIFIDYGNYETHGDIEINIPGTMGPNLFNNNTQFHSMTKRSAFQFGLDIRPGLLVTTDSMLYARAGILYAKRKITFDGADLGFSIAAGETWNASFIKVDENEKDDKIGWRVGAGLEHHICGYWNLRMDYLFTYYGKDTFFGQGSQELQVPGDSVIFTASNTYTVYNNSIMFGLTYALD